MQGKPEGRRAAPARRSSRDSPDSGMIRGFLNHPGPTFGAEDGAPGVPYDFF